MRISLIAVGTRMPAWVAAGIDEYSKRLPPELQFDVREIALGKATDAIGEKDDK